MNKKSCPQMKCTFNYIGGCRKCEVCSCEPNVIDEDCDRCWNCAYDEGILRWDDSTDEESVRDLNKQNEMKEIEVSVK